MRTKLLLLFAAGLALMGLAACSHTSGGGSGSAGGAAGPARGARTAQGERAAVPAQASGGAGTATTRPDTPPLSTVKIRTAELTVSVRGASHVGAQADRAGDIAVDAGGDVDSDDRTSGKNAGATLRLRVPPEQLRAVMTALGRLGTEQDRTSSATDVTERVADVGARSASAREAIDRLRTLYSRAKKIGDVIAVESQLSSRQADLESLEAQQRTLSRQTQLAAVELHLRTAASAPVHRPDEYAGFVGGLRRGWDGFVTAARGVGTALGAMLPFLAVLLLLALVARFAFGLRIPLRRRTPRP